MVCGLVAFAGHVGALSVDALRTPTLARYVQTEKKWDPAKSGPLIAIEPDTAYPRIAPGDSLSTGLKAYNRKLVKLGGISAIALDTEVDVREPDASTGIKDLPSGAKILFLLATLSPIKRAKLLGEGLCADEVSGLQRSAILGLMPHPFVIQDWQLSPYVEQTIPDDRLGKIRFQLRAGRYGFKRFPDLSSFLQGETVPSSQGAGGEPVYLNRNSSTNSDGFRIVPSRERASDLNYAEPSLSKFVSLPSEISLGDAIADLAKESGKEIYADARIEELETRSFGSGATCGGYLRALAVAVGGAYRKVGDAYVLTSSREGEEVRDEKRAIQRWRFDHAATLQIAGWLSEVEKLHLWPDLTEAIAASIKRQSAPSPELQTELAPLCTGRFVLPDGRPIGNSELAVTRQPLGFEFAAPPETVPLDEGGPMLGKGRALEDFSIGIRSDDPVEVGARCRAIRSCGISGVWLDSLSPKAIEAAIRSGLTVDLVVDPWRVLPNEHCADLDRDLLQKSGSELNAAPDLHLEGSSRRTYDYADSFSPGDESTRTHLERVLKAIPTQGLRRIIVRNAQPIGYEPATPGWQEPMFGYSLNNIQVAGSLREVHPEVVRFGFSEHLRLAFLRKHHLDPIDLHFSNFASGGAQAYFGVSPNRGFGTNQPDVQHFERDWAKARHAAWEESFLPFVAALRAGPIPVFVEAADLDLPGTRFITNRVAISGTLVGNPHMTNQPKLWFTDLNPWNEEDPSGKFIFRPGTPNCFDLSDVPSEKFGQYLAFLFGKTEGTN